jgi:methionine biosynthesis protein MetW
MLNKILILFKGIFKPMPLDNNFKDYDEYWQNRGFHAPSLGRAKILSKSIEPGSKILDIGCGDGTVMEFLSKNNKPKEIIGIDISKRAVDYVKNKGYEAYELDVLSDDFVKFLGNKNFDYIIITEVLEHIQDPEKVLLSIKKHFNKSIFISIPNAGFFLHRLRLLFGRFPLVMVNEHVKEHIRFWTHSDFKYWIFFLGFYLKRLNVSSTTRIIGLDLGRFIPSLFAHQIIYEIIRRDQK